MADESRGGPGMRLVKALLVTTATVIRAIVVVITLGALAGE
jgi:hypothetical protein